MAVTFTIDGVDYLPYLHLDSVIIDDAVAEDGDSLEFVLSDSTGSMAVPSAGNEVKLTVNGVTEFGGAVLTVTLQHISSKIVEVSCRCRGYVFWLSRKLVAIDTQDYGGGNPTTGQIVDGIIDDFVNPGLDAGHQFSKTYVANGFTIPRQQFDYARVGQVFDQLAQEIEYSWYVDFDRNVHYFSVETFSGPIDTVDYDNDTDYSGLTLTEDVSQVINRIYVKDVKGKADQPHIMNFTGDGSTTFYRLAFEPSEVTDANVTVNGTPMTVQTDPQTANPAPGAYLCTDNWGLRIVPAPAAGAPVDVSYGYLYPKVIVVDDPASIAEMARRAPGTDGIFEYAISMQSNNRVLDESVPVAKAQLVLLQKSWPLTKGTLTTFVQGWKPGQSFTLTANNFKIANTAFNKRVYIMQTSKRLIVNHSGGVVVSTQMQFCDNAYALKG